MRHIVSILSTTIFLLSNPIDNAYKWIDNEYKNFRTYPRIDRAEIFLKQNRLEEARELLEKSLKIDNRNRRAIDLLIEVCIREKDNRCVDRYSKLSKNPSLGYYYKYRADMAKERGEYLNAIKFLNRALRYSLKYEDKISIKKILFELYLKTKKYKEADKLIDVTNLSEKEILKWSKMAFNLNELGYAYALAYRLPDKIEYLKWRISILLKEKSYKKASKKMEILYAKEPSIKNKRELIHLYKLTKQSNAILNIYKKRLTKKCDRYALEYILDFYKKRGYKKKRIKLLKKYYPYRCLNKRKQMILSMELLKYLKETNSNSFNRVALDISRKIKNQKELIKFYTNFGLKDRLASIYRDILSKEGCSRDALYFLLDYYKDNRDRRRDILEKIYPYRCLSVKERNRLSLELLTLLDKSEIDKKRLILSNLDTNYLNSDNFLYLSNLYYELKDYHNSIKYAILYLRRYPNSINSLKNIGYSYRKLGEKRLALEYLSRAFRLNPNNYQLLKDIGYLSFDLKLYNKTVYYWSKYLNRNSDIELEYQLAKLYKKLDRVEEAKEALKEYEKLTDNYDLDYYLLKAELYPEDRLKYYKEASKLTNNKYIKYEYIRQLKEHHRDLEALNLMERFIDEHSDNLDYKKELAYMYYNMGKKDKAIDIFKKIIDEDINMPIEERENIKYLITDNSKNFHIYSVQSARLNSNRDEEETIYPINSSTYSGYGDIQISLNREDYTIYGEISHKHKNIKETTQTSIGVKYKPIKDREIYISAQQLIKSGELSKDDTLLKTSMGLSSSKDNIEQDLYIEGAYFINSQSTNLYANYESGKRYKINRDTTIKPYITTSATYNNYNDKSTSKLDIGVGVALDIKSDESRYKIDNHKNRLKLEVREGYAGNSKDKESLRLQWEFFY